MVESTCPDLLVTLCKHLIGRGGRNLERLSKFHALDFKVDCYLVDGVPSSFTGLFRKDIVVFAAPAIFERVYEVVREQVLHIMDDIIPFRVEAYVTWWFRNEHQCTVSYDAVRSTNYTLYINYIVYTLHILHNILFSKSDASASLIVNDENFPSLA